MRRFVVYFIASLGVVAAIICAMLWRLTYNNPVHFILSDASRIQSYEGWVSLYRFNRTFSDYREAAVVHYWHLIALFCAPLFILVVAQVRGGKKKSVELPQINETEIMTQNPPPVPTRPTKNWFGRNWKWVIPVGCLTPILLCGGFITIVFAVVFGAMRASDVYKDAIAKAKADPTVITALGSPVEAGMLVSGKINVDGSSGEANLSIPVHGPKGAGTIYLVATKSEGQWEYSKLAVKVDATGERIELPKAIR